MGNKTLKRIKEKLHTLTKRNWSIKLENRLAKLKEAIQGWVNYFSIANCKKVLRRLDEWIRTRLRMCIWKSWKTSKNRIKQLIRLGSTEDEARKGAYTRKKYCRTAHSKTLCLTLTNEYFRKLGYTEMCTLYELRHV